MPSFDKVPNNDQEAQSFDMDDGDYDGSSSSSRSIFDLAKTKYTYLNPKVKYGIGIAAFMLFGTILLSSGSGGKGEQAVDNSMGAGTTGSGSGTGPIIDMRLLITAATAASATRIHPHGTLPYLNGMISMISLII